MQDDFFCYFCRQKGNFQMNNKIKNETRILWEKCFSEEDKRFVDLYFEKRYNDEDNIFTEKDGKVVSALQIMTYPFSYYGKTIACTYISGCCTDPEYRSQGIMNELLAKTLNIAKSRGACFAALIPASESLFNYYETNNFVKTFDYSKIHINKTNQNTTKKNLSDCTISTFDGDYEVYEYFNEKMRSRNCCIQHSEYDFGMILRTMELFDGLILVAKYGEEVCGIAFCETKNNEIFVKEIFAETGAILSDLITAATDYYENESVNIIIPAVSGQKTHHLGMSRIIDAETMLRIYASTHPKLKMEISLVDSIIPQNNGTYYINNGILEKRDSINSNVIDIEQLTQALFGYNTDQLPDNLKLFNKQSAFMSLMLE